MHRIIFKSLLLPGMWAHFARSQLSQAVPHLHTHDFHEVFWVEGGRGLMHTGGGSVNLTAGDFCLVHAADQHGFSGQPGAPLRLANLAFATRDWDAVVQRYGLEKDPMTGPATQRRRQLSADDLGALRLACGDLDHGIRDRLAIERVLLTVLSLIRPRHNEDAPTLPAWLSDSCQAIQAGRWRTGTAALVAASGRSREHVARVCRELLGKTPTELINDLRLRHLSQRLVETDSPIAELAAETGLTNLAHVYRLFRRTYGVSPGAWRARHRGVLMPGG